jgi:gluconolactonase
MLLLKHYLFTCLILLSVAQVAHAQNPQLSTIGSIEETDPALGPLVNKKAAIEIIADGFDWSEGPLWLEQYKMLIFSDVPKNIIYKWTAAKGKEVYLTPSGYTSSTARGGETGSNGLLLNSKGQLVLCQHGDRRMAVMNAPLDHPKPIFVSIADQYKGRKFDSPNDAVYHENGELYFTDPPYGLEKNVDDPNKQAPYQGIYKVSQAGVVTMLTDSITRPNGIAFFPDFKSVIIANSDPLKPFWYIYDIDANGMFANGRIFYDASSAAKTVAGMPDGLKITKDGHVFATGPGGVWIFNREGKVLGKILVKELTSNCAFSPDEKILYITADRYVLKVKLR